MNLSSLSHPFCRLVYFFGIDFFILKSNMTFFSPQTSSESVKTFHSPTNYFDFPVNHSEPRLAK